MAPATKPAAPGKVGPQRSIKSFFSKSPAKALVESSPAKVALKIGCVDAEQQEGSSKEDEEKKIETGVDNAEAKIESTPGKRKAALKVGHDESPQKDTKAVQKLEIGEVRVDDDVAPEDEVTPMKRRRLRKVRGESKSDSLVVSSARASVSSPTPESKIGRRLKVYWPLDKAWYEGRVKAYNASDDNYVVLYDDGDKENVDIVREKVEWLSESEEMETGTGSVRAKRRRSEAVNSNSGLDRGDSRTGDEPAAKVTNVDVERGDAPRRGRPRRQIKCVEESDDGGDDDDEDDADFHVAPDTSEDKESEVDDEEDEESDEPEEESDSDEKPRKRPRKPPLSAVKKPSARGSKKLSKPASAAGVGSGVFKGSSVAKNLSGSNSGRLDSFLGVSNDLPSSECRMLKILHL